MPAHSRRVTERTHSPSPRPGWRPRGLVGLGDAFHEVAGDGVRVCSQLLLDDADIPHRVKTVHTRATLSDEVAAPIVREGYVEWLMNVPDPVPEELERGELGHVVVGSAQDVQVDRDRGEEALRHRRALRDSDRVDRAAHVDEVLLRPLAGMVRPRAGIREGVERGVQGHQPDDFVAGLIVEFLEGDLADDLVAEVAPGPGGRGCHDQGHRKCEADEGTEQLRMAHKESLLQMNAVLPKPRLKSQSPSAVNWTSIFTVRPLQGETTRFVTFRSPTAPAFGCA